MDIAFWIVVVVVAAFAAWLIVSRTASAARSRVDPTQLTIDPALATRVRDLYAAGDKVKAVKALREATGLGLADAVRIADKLGATAAPKQPAGSSVTTDLPSISKADERQVRSLVETGQTLEALRLIRRLTGMDLRQAKAYIEKL